MLDKLLRVCTARPARETCRDVRSVKPMHVDALVFAGIVLTSTSKHLAQGKWRRPGVYISYTYIDADYLLVDRRPLKGPQWPSQANYDADDDDEPAPEQPAEHFGAERCCFWPSLRPEKEDDAPAEEAQPKQAAKKRRRGGRNVRQKGKPSEKPQAGNVFLRHPA